MQLGHLKLSGYGLPSTQALQNRSQKCSSVSQSGATAFPWRYPGPPAQVRPKGVKSTFLAQHDIGFELKTIIYHGLLYMSPNQTQTQTKLALANLHAVWLPVREVPDMPRW